ncbi:MAG: trigger factor, partial [Chloroflexota bacterium]
MHLCLLRARYLSAGIASLLPGDAIRVNGKPHPSFRFASEARNRQIATYVPVMAGREGLCRGRVSVIISKDRHGRASRACLSTTVRLVRPSSFAWDRAGASLPAGSHSDATLAKKGTHTSVKVTVERLPASQVLLDIAADEEEFNLAVEKAARRIAREAVIPGFRKGKVPRQMLERLLGREVFIEEANKDLMDDLYRRALQQEELIPVGEPEVEFVSAEPLAFKVTVPVYPEVDPGAYREVRIEPVDASIDEAKVDEVIERLRVSHSPWVDPAEQRTPREGDQVTVDIVITEGEEPFQPPLENAVFVLGEDQLLDELRTAIEGLRVGETTTFQISYPEEGEGAPDDRRRGKTLNYTVTLKELKERELLPLDDEFVKTYANAESLAALRDRVRANLHAERTREARAEAINQIIEKIVAGASVEIPQAMIEDALNRKVTLSDIKLTIVPRLGVRVAGFTVMDDPAFDSGPFASLSSLDVGVKLLPLLSGRVEVEEIVLEEPVITVIKNRQGVMNISTLGKQGPKMPEAPKEAPPPEVEGPLRALAMLAVDRVSLSGGKLMYLDQSAPKPTNLTIQDLQVLLQSVRLGEMPRLHLAAVVQPYNIPVRLDGIAGPLT